MTITNPQKAILHIAKAKLAWDDETYRQVLVRIAGVTSSTDLDGAGFEAILGFANYCGFQPLGKGVAHAMATGPAWRRLRNWN